MKLIKILLFFSFIIVASACSKDSISDAVEEDNDEVPTVAIRIKVNGTPMKFFGQYSSARFDGENSFSIRGSGFYGIGTITMTINEFNGEGTYQLIHDGSSEPKVYGTYTDDTYTYISPFEPNVIEGEITISHLSEYRVKGNFYFKGTESSKEKVKDITEGTFDMRVF